MGNESQRSRLHLRTGYSLAIQPHEQPKDDSSGSPVDDGGNISLTQGYTNTHNKNVSTIFSAPNYCYRCNNMAAIMDVDENLKQTYIQYDPAPRKGNEVQKKRVPDYFLWAIILSLTNTKMNLILLCCLILLRMSSLSPAQSAKDHHRFSSRNQKNHRLHHALDEAKNYSEYLFDDAVWSMYISCGHKNKIMCFKPPQNPTITRTYREVWVVPWAGILLPELKGSTRPRLCSKIQNYPIWSHQWRERHKTSQISERYI